VIKAILFILLAQNTDGQIMYANGFPVDSCDGKVVTTFIEKLPTVPRGMRMEYVCLEPGPAKITADEQAN
jgi:hypothetical protein